MHLVVVQVEGKEGGKRLIDDLGLNSMILHCCG